MPPTTKKAGAKKSKPKAARGAGEMLEAGAKAVKKAAKKVTRKVGKALEPAGEAIAREAKVVRKGVKKAVKKVEKAAAPIARAITGRGESRGTKKASTTKRAGTKKAR
jgi:hypothetical protein